MTNRLDRITPATVRPMTSSLRLPFVAALAALAIGCVRVRSTPLAAVSYPPVSPDSVRLFATNPPPKYVEIAMMRTDVFFAGDEKSARALRVKAGKLGANGVILLNARAVSTHGGPNVGVILGGSKDGSPAVVVGDGDQDVKEFERAVAIRYEPEPAVAQSAGATPPR